MKIEIELPKRVDVSDCHDFDSLMDSFRKIDRRIKVREIGGCYVGIIYVGSLDDVENKSLINQIKQEEKDENLR